MKESDGMVWTMRDAAAEAGVSIMVLDYHQRTYGVKSGSTTRGRRVAYTADDVAAIKEYFEKWRQREDYRRRLRYGS